MDITNPAPVSVHRHASPGLGSVNSWIIEGPEGLVIVDAQRQLSQAAEVARAAAALNKPVVAVLLTHAHPDHVGGLPALLAAFPAAIVAASAHTAEVMRKDEGGVLALARSFLGDDFAAEMPAPTLILPERGTLDLAGLRIRHAELGPGETVCATLFVVEGSGLAFIGDVAANAFTPWLVEGHSAAWLDQIALTETLLPPGAIAHPGHGAAAEAAMLLAAQRDYLRRFRALVAETAATGRLTPAARAAVLAETERRHPGWPPVAGVPDMPGLNADAVARELGLAVG